MSWTILCLSMLLTGATETRTTTETAAPDDRPTVIVVVGAEGTPEYGQEFARWADRWSDAARRAGTNLVQIGRDQRPTSVASTRPATTRTASTATTEDTDDARDREKLKSTLATESKRPTSQPVWLVLIGHGTFDGRDGKFNLRGLDVSGQDLADWLGPCRRPVALIDCSSSSAPFLNKVSGAGRVVVTATRAGSEIQYSRFGDYFSAAISDTSADLDKDGQTSLLEAFLAASHRVEEFYKTQGRLATEHALLDDNGDALGTPATWFQGIRAIRSARDGAPLDGIKAHQWHLLRTSEEESMVPALAKRRDALEVKIAGLRQKKASLAEADYYAQLEPLLIELAKLYGQTPSAK